MPSAAGSPNDVGRSLLDAAARGDLPAAKRLHRLGDVTGACDVQGSTALHYAAAHGHSAIVQWLLIHVGASVGDASSFGWLPFHEAIYHGNMDVAEQLLAAHAGAPPIRARTAVGAEPLHLALFAGNLDAAEWLLSHNASVHAVDDDGRGALHYACIGGQPAASRWLQQHGLAFGDQTTRPEHVLAAAQAHADLGASCRRGRDRS